MNNLRLRLTFFEQIKLLFKYNRNKLEIRLKELDLELTNAKNRDMKHLDSVAIDILGCDKNTKNPLIILYITRYSALCIDRISNLNLSVNMDDPLTINTAMEMANKGYNDKHIISKVLSNN